MISIHILKQLTPFYSVHILTVNMSSIRNIHFRVAAILLQNPRIPGNVKNLTGSLLAKLDHKDKLFNYPLYMLNSLNFMGVRKTNSH